MICYGPRLEMRALDEKWARLFCHAPDDLARTLGYRAPSGWPSPWERAVVEAFLPAIRQHPPLMGWGPWLILDPLSQQIIGLFTLHGLPDGDCAVEISLHIHGAHRSQGFAKEVLATLLAYIPEMDRIYRVFATLERRNPIAERLLTGAGFKCISHENGRWIYLFNYEDD